MPGSTSEISRLPALTPPVAFPIETLVPEARLQTPAVGQRKPFSTYVYATQIAEVDVDDETGEVEMLRTVAARDFGTPINPMPVEGQIEGGISMGIGFALQEQILLDDAGRQINQNLTN